MALHHLIFEADGVRDEGACVRVLATYELGVLLESLRLLEGAMGHASGVLVEHLGRIVVAIVPFSLRLGQLDDCLELLWVLEIEDIARLAQMGRLRSLCFATLLSLSLRQLWLWCWGTCCTLTQLG